MNRGLQAQKNQSSNSAPMQNQLQSRPFAARAKLEASPTQQETPSSQTQQGRAEGFSHNLANISIFASATEVPIQCAKGDGLNDAQQILGTLQPIASSGIAGGASVYGAGSEALETHQNIKKGRYADAAISGTNTLANIGSGTSSALKTGFTLGGNATGTLASGITGGAFSTAVGGLNLVKDGKKLKDGYTSKKNLNQHGKVAREELDTYDHHIGMLQIEQTNLDKIIAATGDPNQKQQLENQRTSRLRQLNALNKHRNNQAPVIRDVINVSEYGAKNSTKVMKRAGLKAGTDAVNLAGGIVGLATLPTPAAPAGAIVGGSLAGSSLAVDKGAWGVRKLKQKGRDAAAKRPPTSRLHKIFDASKSTPLKQQQRQDVGNRLLNNNTNPKMQQVFKSLYGVGSVEYDDYINGRLTPDQADKILKRR